MAATGAAPSFEAAIRDVFGKALTPGVATRVDFFEELKSCDNLLAPLLKGKRASATCFATRHATRETVKLEYKWTIEGVGEGDGDSSPELTMDTIICIAADRRSKRNTTRTLRGDELRGELRCEGEMEKRGKRRGPE